MKPAYKIFLDAFKRKSLNQPGYSKNALARDLGVSPAFVVNLFSGKRKIPFERLQGLFEILELDIPERQLALKSIITEIAGPKVARSLQQNREEPVSPRQLLNSSKKNLLSSWACIAVLEGLSLNSGNMEADKLRGRLGLSKPVYLEIIRLLKELNLVTDVDGKLKKNESHLYIPVGRSRLEIRNYHQQLIERAKSELITKTSAEEFERRLITSFTFAMNMDHLEETKAEILRFLDRLTNSASSGECHEVYACNVQLIPLSWGAEA